MSEDVSPVPANYAAIRLTTHCNCTVPFCFWVRSPYRTDRQTDGRTAALMTPIRAAAQWCKVD